MTKIKIVGWREGMQKISLTKLLQEELGLPLASAKDVVDRVLDGSEEIVSLPVRADAEAIAAAMRRHGAIAEIADD